MVPDFDAAFNAAAKPLRVAPTSANEEVTFDGLSRVTVTSAPNPELLGGRCPAPPLRLPTTAITAADSVALSRSGCYGTCPVYEVRVYGDGKVSWKGEGFVTARENREASIPREEARALIELFRQPDVWGLFEDFTRSVTDSASARVEVATGGLLKTIDDYAVSAPQWFRELRDRIAVSPTRIGGGTAIRRSNHSGGSGMSTCPSPASPA